MKYLLLLLLLLPGLLLSAPIYDEPVTLYQPDGTELHLLISGDEFYNYIHDAIGFTIMQNPKTGYYVYAVLDGINLVPSNYAVGYVNPYSAGIVPGLHIPTEQIQRKRNAFFNESPKDMGDAPKTGTIRNLIVYIRFADENEFTDLSSYYHLLFNNDSANKNSMLNYFREASYNALSIFSYQYPIPPGSTVISYQDIYVRNYYKPYDSINNPIGYTSSNKTSREHTLLKNAITFIAPLVSDTLNLDGDNDGRVDNVCFIIYGSSTAWADLLWPHRWSLYSQTVYINNKRVYDYNFQLQNSLKSSGVGVLCHEMFHSLGSPDLYHYTSNGISPVYRWDVMDNNRNPPQHMCAHMKWKYGTWISNIPTISAPGTYSMKPLINPTNNSYKILSPHSAIEYFVVEYRRRLSIFENSLPGDGMIIYRINSTLNGNANGPPDEVYAYRPNGTLTANGSPASANYSSTFGRTEINYTTNPNPFLFDGSQGGLNIFGITAIDSTISFTLGVPTYIVNTEIPVEYRMKQNYPNPFNSSTKIGFNIPRDGIVNMKIYDIRGREIVTLMNNFHRAGEYETEWNAVNLSTGVYFCKLISGNYNSVIKMILTK
jgi:M6 family metalloprotease-like protein